MAVDGDEILVTNGTYSTGGRAVTGIMTNRVAITKPLFVHSVNGAQATVIQGYQLPDITNGDGAVRCVYLTNGASLAGFTLTSGATRSNADYYVEGSGAGIFAESTSATISNCIITGNSAWQYGGGAYGGSFADCTFANNSVGMRAIYAYGIGAGVAYATVTRCVLIGNQAGAAGGGGYEVNANNCLVVSNSCPPPYYANGGGGVQSGTLSNCTIVGNAGGGVYSWYYGHGGLGTTLKNCILYYNTNGDDPGNLASGFDHCCLPFQPSYGAGNITNEPHFVNLNSGNFHLETNSPCINAGTNAAAPLGPDLDGNPRIVGGIVDIGAYESVNSSPVLGTHYVAPNNPNPAFPYTDWTTAATNIQDAINASTNGDQIIVTNGLYSGVTGGDTIVAIYKPVTVRSVNGPLFTSINGGGALRCASLTAGATLIGFTLTNGFASYSGGGVYGPFFSIATVQNCIITGNRVGTDGGYSEGGGGASGCTLNNCLIVGNRANTGAGTYFCSMNNCTVVSNTAAYSGGGSWATNGSINNTILYYNSPDNWAGTGFRAGPAAQSYCCTTPDPGSGPGNITNAPVFADLLAANFRLQSNSPCINAGLNTNVVGSYDVDGRLRIVGGTVDIGAYEFQPGVDPLFLGWLQQNGLQTDGSADNADPDGDGLSNSKEYVAHMNPWVWDNVRLESGTYDDVAGLQLTVHGQPGGSYALQASSNLGDWVPIMRVNCPASNSVPVVYDTAGKDYARRFYRLAPLSTIPRPKLGIRLTNDNVEIILQGTVGLNYEVQASDNLLDWSPISLIVCTNTVMYLPDTDAPNYSHRFYRALMP